MKLIAGFGSFAIVGIALLGTSVLTAFGPVNAPDVTSLHREDVRVGSKPQAEYVDEHGNRYIIVGGRRVRSGGSSGGGSRYSGGGGFGGGGFGK